MRRLYPLALVLGAVLFGCSRSENTTANVEASGSPKISGVVRDPQGAPVPGLRLTVGPGGKETKTDANGRYELSWNPQRDGRTDKAFALIARDVARNLALARDTDWMTETVDLQLQPGLVVVGRVEDPEGNPVTNATLQLILLSGNMGSGFDAKPIGTDAQGRFEITALPPDRRYILFVNAKGYGSGNQEVRQADAETNRVELAPFVLKVADRKLAGQVLDADQKPVASTHVYIYGEGQPNSSTQTDQQGRFAFDQVCEGLVRLSANGYGNTTAQAGDTNVVITPGVRESFVREVPKRPSLKGKPLPDLAATGLAADAVPAGRPALLCLFDHEQRPSRRFVRQLADQYDTLKQQGLSVVAVQTAGSTAESFQTWKAANPVPFPVGRVAEKSDKAKWASGVESLPWLIVADKEGRVAAEGFAIDELAAKMKALEQ